MDTALLSAENAGTIRAPWMHSRTWDLGWLIGSVVIVPLVLVLVWSGLSNDILNLTVTTLIGGPHLFSTYTATYMDRRFRTSHRWMLLGTAILIPSAVVFGVLVNYQILLSIFIFAASLHVLQQNAYLADIYRQRAAVPEPAWYRWIDYGFVGLSFYPIASYKLVHSNFMLGDVEIILPRSLMNDATYWLAGGAFAIFSAIWIGKTLAESRNGTLNGPKAALLGVTAITAFMVPMAASGERLELAFQAINAWHSFQYLGLIWLVQYRRKQMGLLESPFISKITGPGVKSFSFYGFCFVSSSLLLLSMLALSRWDPFNLHKFNPYYYMGVLSFLLIHYVLDAYLFTVSCVGKQAPADNPYASLAAR